MIQPFSSYRIISFGQKIRRSHKQKEVYSLIVFSLKTRCSITAAVHRTNEALIRWYSSGMTHKGSRYEKGLLWITTLFFLFEYIMNWVLTGQLKKYDWWKRLRSLFEMKNSEYAGKILLNTTLYVIKLNAVWVKRV